MLLIKEGRVVDPASGVDEVLDILVRDGRIERIGRMLSAKGSEVIDARGLVVAPGLIDTHVHFREPGEERKETIATGAGAAAAGGFTTVICMANTIPPVDEPGVLREILAKGARTGIHVLQAATVTRDRQGRKLTDFAELKAAGAACFTDDGSPVMGERLARTAMERAAELDMTLSFHEEDPAFVVASGVNEGAVSRALGHPGASAEAEERLVERDCALARETGARIVIQHISTAGAVDMVRKARADGVDVWAEVTPHHFSLTERAVLEHGPLAKMNPPLRTESDRQALIAGLRDGTIAMIATDHAPHTASEKAKPLLEAPSGIIGLETALALGITHLVRKGHVPLQELLEKMTVNPAVCYRLDVGTLREGGPADLMLFDPDEAWTVGDFTSKSANSPFVGQRLYGRVHYTICAGNTVYKL